MGKKYLPNGEHIHKAFGALAKLKGAELKELEHRLVEGVQTAVEKRQLARLAEIADMTPDRLERVAKRKLPENQNVMQKLDAALNALRLETQPISQAEIIPPSVDIASN